MRWVLSFLLLVAAALAQVPDKFTNLQVFPKDISSKELISTMRGFCFSLGVRCEYCHAGKAVFGWNASPATMAFPGHERSRRF
jgi:hypothetical protein